MNVGAWCALATIAFVLVAIICALLKEAGADVVVIDHKGKAAPPDWFTVVHQQGLIDVGVRSLPGSNAFHCFWCNAALLDCNVCWRCHREP